MGAYNDEILFLHIPKCGGTSVKRWLKAALPGVKDSTDEECPLPIGHIPLRDVERFTGRKPESFAHIIAVIRDPYAQQLSQWMFWADRYRRGNRHIHDIGAASHATLTGWLHDPRCDFHLWYESAYPRMPAGVSPLEAAPRDPFERAKDGGGYRWWLEVDGKIPANLRVIRLEELPARLPAILFPFMAGDMVPVPLENPGPARYPARDYYTPLAARIVEAKFRWTFDEGYYPTWADEPKEKSA